MMEKIYTIMVVISPIMMIWLVIINTYMIKTLLESTGIIFKRYPKHYAMPSPRIRKFFRLKKKEIPIFLLVRLYITVFYGILTLIMPLVMLLVGFIINETVALKILIASVVFLGFDRLLVMATMYFFEK